MSYTASLFCVFIFKVAEGKNEQYGFKWFGILYPVEDILFSDTVIKLIF